MRSLDLCVRKILGVVNIYPSVPQREPTWTAPCTVCLELHTRIHTCTILFCELLMSNRKTQLHRVLRQSVSMCYGTTDYYWSSN